jgi:hypothetical protein
MTAQTLRSTRCGRGSATAMLCSAEVSQAAHDLAWILYEAVRRGPRSTGS